MTDLTNVKVVIRVRPLTTSYLASGKIKAPPKHQSKYRKPTD